MGETKFGQKIFFTHPLCYMFQMAVNGDRNGVVSKLSPTLSKTPSDAVRNSQHEEENITNFKALFSQGREGESLEMIENQDRSKVELGFTQSNIDMFYLQEEQDEMIRVVVQSRNDEGIITLLARRKKIEQNYPNTFQVNFI